MKSPQLGAVILLRQKMPRYKPTSRADKRQPLWSPGKRGQARLVCKRQSQLLQKWKCSPVFPSTLSCFIIFSGERVTSGFLVQAGLSFSLMLFTEVQVLNISPSSQVCYISQNGSQR